MLELHLVRQQGGKGEDGRKQPPSASQRLKRKDKYRVYRSTRGQTLDSINTPAVRGTEGSVATNTSEDTESNENCRN